MRFSVSRDIVFQDVQLSSVDFFKNSLNSERLEIEFWCMRYPPLCSFKN